MIEFIIENYYVILVICILLIFGIIGYIFDTLKTAHYKDLNAIDTYVPEEDIFIQSEKKEEIVEEPEQSTDELINEYYNEKEE